MRHLHLSFISIIFFSGAILPMLQACNDDIFVDGEFPADSYEMEIEGDGGQFTIDIPVKGLKHIAVDRYSSAPDANKGFTYYDKAGNVMPFNSPASEISRILYETPMLSYEMTLSGNRFSFHSIENCYDLPINEYIRFTYDYKEELVYVSIQPGQPTELIDVAYDPELSITDEYEIRDSSWNFSNLTEFPYYLATFPFQNSNPTSNIVVDTSWAKGLYVEMPLLVYDNGEWILKKAKNVLVGYLNTLPFPNKNISEDVEIPPMTTAKILSSVIYSRASANGTMTFRNPVSEKTHQVKFTCTTTYPTSYYISTQPL